MGGARGHLYVTIPGSHRQWRSYDQDGKHHKERSSQTAARVIESGTLINNTKLPVASGGGGGSGPRVTPSDDEVKESKIMCAPVTAIDPFYKEGTVVS